MKILQCLEKTPVHSFVSIHCSHMNILVNRIVTCLGLYIHVIFWSPRRHAIYHSYNIQSDSDKKFRH